MVGAAIGAALQGKRVLLQNRGVWTLLHARDPNLLVPFIRCAAFFSRLDGEWWMRFGGEPEYPADAQAGAQILVPKRALSRPAS